MKLLSIQFRPSSSFILIFATILFMSTASGAEENHKIRKPQGDLLLRVLDTYRMAGFKNGEEFVYHLCQLSLERLGDAAQREKTADILDDLEPLIQNRNIILTDPSSFPNISEVLIAELKAVRKLYQFAAAQLVANLTDDSFDGERYRFLTLAEVGRYFPEIELNVGGYRLDWEIIIEGAMIDLEAVPENREWRSFLLTFEKGFVSLFAGNFKGESVDPYGNGTTQPELRKWFLSEEKDKEGMVTRSHGYIPSLKAAVTELKFFEGGAAVLTPEKRIYQEKFLKSSTRYIWWELNLRHPAPQSRKDFVMEAVYYGPDGSGLSRQTVQTFLKPEWESSIHQQGWGMQNPGNWAPGIYRVELSVQGLQVASGTFEIVRDENQYIPSLDAWVDRLMFFESGSEPVPDGLWVFKERFSKKNCRNINWLLSLDHPHADRPKEFTITAIWYLPDNSVWTEQSTRTGFESGRDSSWHTASLGWEEPGHWPLGTYRVELSIGGRVVAVGHFEIVQ